MKGIDYLADPQFYKKEFYIVSGMIAEVEGAYEDREEYTEKLVELLRPLIKKLQLAKYEMFSTMTHE
jgi:hypothetical protein